MVKINYSELLFDHIVVFNSEDTIFACCRENGSGKLGYSLSLARQAMSILVTAGQTAGKILEEPDCRQDPRFNQRINRKRHYRYINSPAAQNQLPGRLFRSLLISRDQ